MASTINNLFGSMSQFTREASGRARDRRDRDKDWRRQDEDLFPGGIPDPAYRESAMLSYAYSANTDTWYVGYSGGAGGIVERHEIQRHQMATRRLDRLKGELPNVSWEGQAQGTVKGARPICTCGEAAALSIALSHGEQIGNLVFISFNTNGRVQDPCQNCRAWIQQYALGYIDKNGRFVRSDG